MKRAEVWQGECGEWYVITTHCRPRSLRRMERISESAFPEDHEDNDERPFPTHEDALRFAIAEVGLDRPDSTAPEQRIRDLHATDPDGNCAHCTRGRVYPVPAPCATVRALEDGAER